MKGQIIYIEHDNALFLSNENAKLVWWSKRFMCIRLL